MRGKEVAGFGTNSHIHEKCMGYPFPFNHLLWLLSAPFQSIPGWWIWFCYVYPFALTLRGIITSQLGGDVETIIAGGAGFEGPVKKYLDVTFDYGPDMIGVSVAELGGFCLFFFIIFAVSIKVLNFQKR